MDRDGDWLFAPADWLFARDRNLPTFLFLLMPVALVQVIWLLAFAVPVMAVICAPWVGLGYLIWWLT